MDMVETAKSQNSLYTPGKAVTCDKSQNSKGSTLSVKLKDGLIWELMRGKDLISDLRKKLGVEISVDEDQQITIKGRPGPVQMCRTILLKQTNPSTSKTPVVSQSKPNVNSCMESPEFKTTATLLAMSCNLGN